MESSSQEYEFSVLIRYTGFTKLLLPESGHVFEGLSLRFRNKFPDEYGSENADDSVQAVGEGVTEILHRAEAHVVERKEGRRDDEVEYPLESHRYGYCRTTDGVREDLRDEYPADRPPAEHERGTVDHYADDRHNRWQ